MTTQPSPSPSPPAANVDFSPLRAKLLTYLKNEEVDLIEEAFHFGATAHEGQKRVSGEPYIIHPLAVAEIVADWRLDAQAIIAALLHDVVEDTSISIHEIAARFGKSAANLVQGLSKLDKLHFKSHQEAQAENFRKMFLAMAADLRIILIKLADRLHNMRTLKYVRPEKRRRIADETLEIYARIANRLGLNDLYHELQDLAFRNKYPLRYQVLEKAIRTARGHRREIVGKIQKTIEERLPQWGVQAKVFGREKHLYSIYRKMRGKNLSFSQVLDIYGFRIIVPEVASCYVALGALHALYKPLPGKFKDIIALPKNNGYQSLHSTLIGPFGIPIEIQIRTQEMHHIAESGIASHWLYKEEDSISLNELEQKTHSWLQSMIELQSATGEASEFFEHVKIDLFPDEVYVFSPKGRIFNLPRGATPVDFAYAVHTDIGHRAVACRINGELSAMRTELRNGDIVEIITAIHPNPNPMWLSYVRTSKARAQIRHFLKNAQHDGSVVLGEHLLNQALRPHGLTLAQVSTYAWDHFLRDRGVRRKEEIFSSIALGKRLPAIVARRLTELQEKEFGHNGVIKPKTGGAIIVLGDEGSAIQLARCCQPIPGDNIVGMVRKGQGLEVHQHDCPQISRLRNNHRRWIDVEWGPETDRRYLTTIEVTVENTRGVLGKIASAITESGTDIQNVHMSRDTATELALHFTLLVPNRQHLAQVIRRLRHIPHVKHIEREFLEMPTAVQK